MKKIVLLLAFFVSAPLWASLDEESDDTLSRSSDRSYNAIVTFTYDNAGNIIQKVYGTVLTNSRNNENENQRSMIDDIYISVKADRTWKHVTISIPGYIDGQNVKIGVYNLSGINCFSGEMAGNYMQINLSNLTRGVYLFQFNIDGEIKSYKLIKH